MPPPRVLCDEFYEWVQPHKLAYLAMRRDEGDAVGKKWLNNTFKTAFLAMPFSNPSHELNLGDDGLSRLKESTAEELFTKVSTLMSMHVLALSRVQRVSSFFREAWKQAQKDLKAAKSKASESDKTRIRAATALELFASEMVTDLGEQLRTATASRLQKYSSKEEKAKHKLSVRATVLAEMFEALSDDEKEDWMARAEEAQARMKAQRASPEEVAR